MAGIKGNLKNRIGNTDGSSMISVLVAFIILLVGVAGFSKAVTTANNMVRRAEMLNAATGEVLEQHFYPDYVNQAPSNSSYVLDVFQADKDGKPAGDVQFSLHGRLREREYTVEITDESGEAKTPIKYEMYFYK